MHCCMDPARILHWACTALHRCRYGMVLHTPHAAPRTAHGCTDCMLLLLLHALHAAAWTGPKAHCYRGCGSKEHCFLTPRTHLVFLRGLSTAGHQGSSCSTFSCRNHPTAFNSWLKRAFLRLLMGLAQAEPLVALPIHINQTSAKSCEAFYRKRSQRLGNLCQRVTIPGLLPPPLFQQCFDPLRSAALQLAVPAGASP